MLISSRFELSSWSSIQQSKETFKPQKVVLPLFPVFNDAFAKDKDAAMKSTSIGLPQILGIHYKRLGFASVG
ncbi:MAG TPA: hypothetical protein DIT10_06845 [Chryseobacterium sp.]|nr:hypothetical protein [Chryseobacterium sp.]